MSVDEAIHASSATWFGAWQGGNLNGKEGDGGGNEEQACRAWRHAERHVVEIAQLRGQ